MSRFGRRRGEASKRVARTHQRLLLAMPPGPPPAPPPGVELAAISEGESGGDGGINRRAVPAPPTASVAWKRCGAEICGWPIGCQAKNCRVLR